MMFSVLCGLAFLSAVSGSFSNDASNFESYSESFSYPEDTSFTVKLYHAFNSSLDYEERAIISISNHIPNIAQKPISLHHLSLLKDSAISGELYYLKAAAFKSSDAPNPYQISSTFLRACSLLESSLSDQLVLNLDATGKFVSLSANVANQPCERLFAPAAIGKVQDIERSLDNHFNSTIFMSKTTVSQGPETRTYLARIEQEKIEKVKGAKQDNRSFIAKYWMYIVPVVIFMFISSAVNPEGGAAQ